MSSKQSYFCDACEREINHLEIAGRLMFTVTVNQKYVEGYGQIKQVGELEICLDCLVNMYDVLHKTIPNYEYMKEIYDIAYNINRGEKNEAESSDTV